MAQTPQIILIDGPAGAGKTTLSLELQKKLSCEVIHLDSVYNGWDEALNSSLTEVLDKLTSSFLDGVDFELPIYNWKSQSFDSTKIIKAADTLIIEGVGAGQSAIRGRATTLYWVDVESAEGLRRVLERDGFEIEPQMQAWKIREAKHFELERTREFADFIISTS